MLDVSLCDICVFFLMIRRPPISTRTDTLFPTRRSSDLLQGRHDRPEAAQPLLCRSRVGACCRSNGLADAVRRSEAVGGADCADPGGSGQRSEEHTSELQSLMRSSYDVFCLKKTKPTENTRTMNEHNTHQVKHTVK